MLTNTEDLGEETSLEQEADKLDIIMKRHNKIVLIF
jgi:hypothetical protein